MSYIKFAKDVGTTGITNILVALSGFILLPILTKKLGITDYGIWVQINITLSLFPIFATLGLPYTLIRFLPGEKNEKYIRDGFYSVFILVFIISTFISIILMVEVSVIADFLDCSKDLLWILCLLLPVECLIVVCIGALRAFQRIKLYSVFILIKTYGEVMLFIVVLIKGYGIFEIMVSSLFVRMIILLFMFSSICRKIKPCFPKFYKIREYIAFGFPTIPGNVSSWIIDMSDRYIISFFLGAASVGYYNPGYSLGNIIGMLVTPLGLVMPATLAEMYDTGKFEQVKYFLNYTLKYFLALGIPAFLGLSVLSKDLLATLSTPDIASKGYMVTPFVTLSSLLFGIIVIISQSIVMAKKTSISGFIWLLAAIFNLILNVIFVPYIGILAAAASTLATYLFSLVLFSYYSFRFIKIDLDWIFIGKCVLASIAMSLLIYEVHSINIFIRIILGASAYLMFIFLFRLFSDEELAFLKGVVGIKKTKGQEV